MGKKIATILAILIVISVAVAVYYLNPFQKEYHSGLQVITNDVEATLFLNDSHLDKAPYINRKIKPGRYILRIVPDDNRLMEKELSINLTERTLTAVYWKPAATLEESSGVVYELERITARDTGEVQIITEPNEAIIHFGNREQEFAPHIFREIEAGTHSITLSLPSYETQDQRFSLSAGYRLKITAYLGREKMPEGDNQDEELKQTESANTEGEGFSHTSYVLIQPTNFFQQEVEVLRVRSRSTLSSESVGFVKVGQRYAFLETENDWYRITFEDVVSGEIKEGWVSKRYVEVIEIDNKDNNNDEE